MPSHPTRRSFIAASLVAPAALPVNDSLALVDVEKRRLMQHREYLKLEITKLDRKWASAYEVLPTWCKTGPKYRDELSVAFGPIVGWPEVRRWIQVGEGQWLVRPSPGDLRELINQEIASVGREVAFGNYRLRVREMRDRLRLRRQISRSAELPTSRDWLPLDVVLEEVEAVILDAHR